MSCQYVVAKNYEDVHLQFTCHAATTWKIDKEKEPLSINVATFQRQLRKLNVATFHMPCCKRCC